MKTMVQNTMSQNPMGKNYLANTSYPNWLLCVHVAMAPVTTAKAVSTTLRAHIRTMEESIDAGNADRI